MYIIYDNKNLQTLYQTLWISFRASQRLETESMGIITDTRWRCLPMFTDGFSTQRKSWDVKTNWKATKHDGYISYIRFQLVIFGFRGFTIHSIYIYIYPYFCVLATAAGGWLSAWRATRPCVKDVIPMKPENVRCFWYLTNMNKT
jgi:hypothetical protein